MQFKCDTNTTKFETNTGILLNETTTEISIACHLPELIFSQVTTATVTKTLKQGVCGTMGAPRKEL